MRLAKGGLIDRGAPVTFRFDGRQHQGFAGDTLASALMGAGVRLMGRSFKYHRPRGVLTAGSEEPNALMTIGAGDAAEPNVRATVQELWPGLVARSQNHLGPLSFDLLSVNDALAPFLGAGFYYKTFMWPRAFWEGLYEPIIRRAAGLGRLSGIADDEVDERGFAFCDVLVIGAGPAGLMAALAAGRAGARVIVADESARMGGRLLSETGEVGGQSGADWAGAMLAELEAMPNVRLMPRCTVTGAYDGGTYGALERVALHLAPQPGRPRHAFWRIHAPRAVLAAGALERPLAFAGNDRPGVMLAGALRAYLGRYGVAPAQEVAIFGAGPQARKTAQVALDAGLTVTGLIDPSPEAAPSRDYPVFSAARVTATRGRLGLKSVHIAHSGGEQAVHAGCLAMTGGWNPNVALACHMGGKPRWDAVRAAFLADDGMVPGLALAGAAAGSFSTAACLREGWQAGADAAEAVGHKAPAPELPEAEDDPFYAPASFVFTGPRAFVDFQNDVTVKDIAQAAAEGMGAPEHMKRYTTQGMATDQGKNSNVVALAVLAETAGAAMGANTTTTFRPPYAPVPIAAMGGGGRGQGFAPERRITSDAALRAAGVPMVEAGLWYRPSYFPRAGESHWRQSCDREVAMVRAKVGVCDVSTLGKIDVQGSDAAAFLDLIYTGTLSRLAVGRVRYGLMLREDGHVMDDGTCARLAEAHYLITTTTAAAGPVMRHLDFVLQVLRPDLDVQICSATEAWAQFAIAGPMARVLANALLDKDITAESLPFMSWAQARVMGVAGRIFRISFSGEMGFEIAVPVAYGASLWRLLLAQAENLGGGAYGMEALNVLRIEKGFITHAEIDGRVTAFDIGFEGMVAKAKDCIGLAASRRPGLLAENRERLVGLKAVEGAVALSAGAFLFDKGAAATREFAQGHLTSACWSPTLGASLALGFLKEGPARHGEVVKMVDHLRGTEALCLVCDPVFFDPEGGRMRG